VSLDSRARSEPCEPAAAQHRGVPAAMAEADGRPRRGGVQLRGGGEPAEERFVESFTADPVPVVRPGRARAHRRQHVGHPAERGAVEMRLARGEREEMEVRIDQTGKHRRPRAVDATARATGHAAHVGRASDRQDAAAADRDRACRRRTGVECHDPGALEYPGIVRQSDDGSGFASLSFISWSQQLSSPPPGLLHSTSAPQESQRYRLPSWVAMPAAYQRAPCSLKRDDPLRLDHAMAAVYGPRRLTGRA
jgi:hypothetical protein